MTKDGGNGVLDGFYDLFLLLLRLGRYPVLIFGFFGIGAGGYRLLRSDASGLPVFLIGTIIVGLLLICWKPIRISTQPPRRDE